METTLVSTLPFQLNEEKPGLIPSIYRIPKASYSGISVCHIKDGYHLVLVPLADEKVPPMKVTDLGEIIAEGIITDYIGSSLAISYEPKDDPESLTGTSLAVPGLFFKKGIYTVDEINKKFPAEVASAKRNSLYWFEKLVKMADDDWTRYHKHEVVSDLQRSACNYLQLQREWNFEVMTSQANLCWSCKTSVHPDAIICRECKAVLNTKAYEARKKEFANV